MLSTIPCLSSPLPELFPPPPDRQQFKVRWKNLMHAGNGDGNIQRGRPKGHNTGALGLFKERLPPVLINPHFTFHISGRLSGPTGRKSIHLPHFLCSHEPFVAHVHAPLTYPCRLAQFQPLLLSRSLSEPPGARVFIFFPPSFP